MVRLFREDVIIDIKLIWKAVNVQWTRFRGVNVHYALDRTDQIARGKHTWS